MNPPRRSGPAVWATVDRRGNGALSKSCSTRAGAVRHTVHHQLVDARGTPAHDPDGVHGIDELLRPEPLPVERLLFDSPIVRVGAFRCPGSHPLFADSGPIVNPVFVFPRTPVWIQHEGGAPFLSDPTVATLYNRGQTYRRRSVAGHADHCDWFALAPEIIAEIAEARRARPPETPERPFARACTPVDSRTYLVQRQLVTALATGRPDALFVEENVISLAARIVESEAGCAGTARPRAAVSARTLRQHRDHAEQAREILAVEFACSGTVAGLAARVGVSAFHLCRVFHRHTGLTLHAYRTELRLRHALERLPETDAGVTPVALDAGFSSHSHFTAAFRRTFGLTPSAFRLASRRRAPAWARPSAGPAGSPRPAPPRDRPPPAESAAT